MKPYELTLHDSPLYKTPFLSETTGRADLQEDELYNFFRTVITEAVDGSTTTKTVVTAILTTLFGFSTASSYIASAKHFAKDNDFLKMMLPASEFFSIGFLNTWLLNDILNLLNHAHSDKNVNRSKKIILFLIPALLAFFTSLPSTIIGLTYNSKHPELALFAFLGDMVSNTYTYCRISHALFKKPDEFAQGLGQRLKLGVLEVINHPEDETQHFLSEKNIPKLLHETAPFDKTDTISLLKDLILRGSKIKKKKEPYNRYYHNKTRTVLVTMTSSLLPLSWTSAAFIVVKNHIESELNYPVLAKAIAVSSSVPLYFLLVIFSNRITNEAIDFGIDFFSGNHLQNYAQYYYPYSSLILSFISLVFAGFSFGTTASVVEENFSDDVSRLLLPIVTSATIMFRFYALLQCANKTLAFLGCVSGPRKDTAHFYRLIHEVADKLPSLPSQLLKKVSTFFDFKYYAADVSEDLDTEFRQMCLSQSV